MNLEQIKVFLRDQLNLPPYLILIFIGLILHTVFCAMLRKPMTSPWGLIAPLIFGIGLESYEIWMHYKDVGLTAPQNDPVLLILIRHSLDVMKIIAVPLLLIVYGSIFHR